MKILDALHPDAIISDLKAQDKKGILEELVAPVSDISGVSHKELVRVLMEREQLGSTGIGEGVGIPHGKTKGIDSIIIGVGLSRKGVDFDSIDGKPAHIFFTLITSDKSTDLHLKLLARISRILRSQDFRNSLLNASSSEDIYTIIKNEDDLF